MQKTLRKAIEVSGIGIFTGEEVRVKICPSSVDTGIVFQRMDLEGMPIIPAKLEFVQDSSRCTRLGVKGASIVMVEHLLSALYAYGIDNARIEVVGPEIPGCDGSAKLFADLIEKTGCEIQERPQMRRVVEEPIFWSSGNMHLVALPCPEFKLSYTLHYPNSPYIKSQYYSFCLSSSRYRDEIAPCRTFSLYEEILPLLEKGLLKGGALENAVLIQGDKVLNPEGTRFPDEMVRHKILDLIGDLSLLGSRLSAHVIAICSGHAANAAFAKVLSEKCYLGAVHV